MYSSSEVQDVSSSVLSSKSGRLPQSNTFTPGGKETKEGKKKKKGIFGLWPYFEVAQLSILRQNNPCKTQEVTFMMNKSIFYLPSKWSWECCCLFLFFPQLNSEDKSPAHKNIYITNPGRYCQWFLFVSSIDVRHRWHCKVWAGWFYQGALHSWGSNPARHLAPLPPGCRSCNSSSGGLREGQSDNSTKWLAQKKPQDAPWQLPDGAAKPSSPLKINLCLSWCRKSWFMPMEGEVRSDLHWNFHPQLPAPLWFSKSAAIPPCASLPPNALAYGELGF